MWSNVTCLEFLSLPLSRGSSGWQLGLLCWRSWNTILPLAQVLWKNSMQTPMQWQVGTRGLNTKQSVFLSLMPKHIATFLKCMSLLSSQAPWNVTWESYPSPWWPLNSMMIGSKLPRKTDVSEVFPNSCCLRAFNWRCQGMSTGPLACKACALWTSIPMISFQC